MGLGVGMQESLCLRTVCSLMVSMLCVLQVLRYFDYVFTGVFTFEMVIKVRATRVHLTLGLEGSPVCASRTVPSPGLSPPGQ